MSSGDSVDKLVGKDVSVRVAESMHDVEVCLQMIGGAPKVSYAEKASAAPEEFAKLAADMEQYETIWASRERTKGLRR